MNLWGLLLGSDTADSVEEPDKVRFGTIVGISAFGPYPSAYCVSIEEDATGELFSLAVQNTQMWHPIGAVADRERFKRGLPTGQFEGARISVEGLQVAFVVKGDETGTLANVIHLDAWREIEQHIKDHGVAHPEEIVGADQW